MKLTLTYVYTYNLKRVEDRGVDIGVPLRNKERRAGFPAYSAKNTNGINTLRRSRRGGIGYMN